MTDVGKREDAMLEKIHELTQERDRLITQLAANNAELELYRTFVTAASANPAHV